MTGVNFPSPPPTEPGAPIGTSKRSGLWRPIVLLLIIISLLVTARLLDLGQYIDSLRSWIEALGPWGPIVFVLLYAAAVLAAIPGSALTVLAGALFGSVLGIAVVINAATLGASLAFLAARYFARDAVAHWLSRKDSFRRLDELTERHGAIIVALTRLVPLFPFNLLNYGFGLTRIRFWTYVIWSWICMLPGTILFVVGADVLTQVMAEGEVSWPLVLTLAAAAIGLGLLIRFARKKLQAKERESS